MSRVGEPEGHPAPGWMTAYGPWLAFGCVLVGVVIELSTPRYVMFTGAFTAAPLVAAALWTFRGTAAVLVTSLAVMAALAFGWDRLPVYESVLRLATVSGVGVLALSINWDLGRHRERLAASRRIAETAQFAILPKLPERIDGLTLAARYQAAHTGAQIGGDLYAVQRSPYGTRILVGDVRGKGLIAIDALTVVLGAFREGAVREPDLAVVSAWVEQAIHRESEQRGGPDWSEEFVTAVLVEIPAHPADRVRIVNCGHPPPLLLDQDGSVRTLEPTAYAPPIGLGDIGLTVPWHADDFVWEPGAQLLLYTDGVSEARNGEGTFYDPAARLGGHRFPTPGALLDALLADVERHTGGRTSDDMALLAIARG